VVGADYPAYLHAPAGAYYYIILRVQLKSGGIKGINLAAALEDHINQIRQITEPP
jgi:hypothetical protein